ncbi:MAG TPA: contact-dependent growth inhibition system immunity protein, partial [Haliangium sp.]|nr:contact-dependent growth inhibition system immunity protein [Haliangium sp.]
MSYDDSYPKLGQFLGGYFHQSWPDDHVLAGASFEDVVRYFQAMNPAATVGRTTRELEEFLGLELTEKELRDVLLYEFNSQLRAPGLGLTYRQWLEAIL